jgi:hypothetical protein
VLTSRPPDDLPNAGELPDEPFLIDRQLVEKIKAQALIDAGYTREQDDSLHSDEEQLKVAVLGAMTERHVARGRRDLVRRAVTKFELYAEMLPNAPGVQQLPRTIEETYAQDQLKKKMWSWLNYGTTGYVQTRIAELGYVLCEAPVARTKMIEETRKKEPTTETGRFLTTNGELIMDYYTGPAAQRFLAAARKLDAQLGLVVARRPELGAAVASQVGVVVRQAVGAIPHADAREREQGSA